MLLTLDVGNTNITAGVFDGSKLVASFRITTEIPRTSDEYGFLIMNLIENNKISVESINSCIIASVVPNIMHSLTSGIIKYFDITPMIVNSKLKMDIGVNVYNPRKVGADRLVDCMAAYILYGGPVIVVDFGTATTYDYVDEAGVFSAGVTAPGIRISAKALSDFAAALPEIEIVKPKTILAKETVTSMQAGLYYGQVGQAEYIINQIKKETGKEKVLVVATGGLGALISKGTKTIDVYDPNLTLTGMRLIYEKNCNEKS